MAKKKGSTGKRVKVKGYTKYIAKFDGVARAHAVRVTVKAHTREPPKKKRKK